MKRTTPAPLLKVDEAAAYLNVSAGHLRNLVHARAIPFRKLGPARNAAIRFDVAELDAWMQHSQVAS